MNRFFHCLLPVILALAGTPHPGSECPVPSPAGTIQRGEDTSRLPVQTIESYETLVRETMRQNKVVGAGAALILENRVVWKKGFGYADKEKNIPYTTRTAQAIGSVTKPITVLGVMELQEKGLLHIDRPLTDSLPAFRIRARGENLSQITLRSLITHTSGLPNDIFKNAALKTETYSDIPSYLPNETLAFPPGTIYHYSNLGMNLLGNVIKAVSKQDYPEYMQKSVFRKIGMDNTGFIGYDQLRDVSQSYDGEGNPVPTPRIRMIPAGGAYSTVDDLTALARELIAAYHGKKGGILRPETVREIFREQKTAKIGIRISGLGWDMFKKESAFIAFHFGSDNVNQACLMIDPERKSALAAMSNSAGGRVLTDALGEKFRTDHGFEELDWIVRHTENPRNNELIPLTPEMIQAHSGTYGHTKLVFDAIPNEGRLLLKYGQTTLDLSPVSSNEFIPSKRDEAGTYQRLDANRIIFEEIGPYHVLFWETEARQREALGYKLAPQAMTDDWMRRLGKYRIIDDPSDGPETFTDVELSEFENRLLRLKIFYTSGIYEYNLRIENDHELVTCGFDEVTGGDTLRFKREGNDVFMTIYGLTLKKIE